MYGMILFIIKTKEIFMLNKVHNAFYNYPYITTTAITSVATGISALGGLSMQAVHAITGPLDLVGACYSLVGAADKFTKGYHKTGLWQLAIGSLLTSNAVLKLFYATMSDKQLRDYLSTQWRDYPSTPSQQKANKTPEEKYL
jgi:hypothetical protein